MGKMVCEVTRIFFVKTSFIRTNNARRSVCLTKKKVEKVWLVLQFFSRILWLSFKNTHKGYQQWFVKANFTWENVINGPSDGQPLTHHELWFGLTENTFSKFLWQLEEFTLISYINSITLAISKTSLIPENRL